MILISVNFSETVYDQTDEYLNYLISQSIVQREEQEDIDEESITPNAVQHNLPAWALFAIFFIVLPLSINIIKEKDQGINVRIQALPVSFFQIMLSKIIVYSMVCMIQFYIMLLVGIYLFPIIGLPALEMHGAIIALSIVALFSSLAAIGFGFIIGTLTKTHEQAAPFGATSIVILAAIGGLWFPTFAMPKIMQVIAKFSSMNWGLESFYNILLRKLDLASIGYYLFLLFAFFAINILIALYYNRRFN